MTKGTMLWGIAGFFAGYFLMKTFASAEAFAKSVATDTSSVGWPRRHAAPWCPLR